MPIGYYRKKPVIIEALKFTGDNWLEVEAFVPVGKYNDDGTFQIMTLEGEHKCSIGDYVIKGVAGEFYPCKPDIFEKTYEVAEEFSSVKPGAPMSWEFTGAAKACPFCGGTDVDVGVVMLMALPSVLMGCRGCGASVPLSMKSDNVTDAWNRRTPEPVPEDVKDLAEHIAAIVRIDATYGRDEDGSPSYHVTNTDEIAEKIRSWAEGRTPEPMTSVVRWVRVDLDDPATYPAMGTHVLVAVDGCVEYMFYSVKPDSREWISEEGERFAFDSGDVWAEIPQPPEDQG